MTTKGLYILCISFVWAVYSFGQTRHNVWLRGTLGYGISEKLESDLEFQYRRQSGVDTKMPFRHDLMQSVRNWTRYRFSDRLFVSVSPFAYFKHYRIVTQQGDHTFKPSREFRFSAALTWKKEIGRGFELINRGAAEYRIFNNGTDDVTRVRDRIGVQYGFENFSILVFNEFLANVAGVDRGHFVDHNRIGTQLEYRPKPQVKLRLGYLYIDRLPLKGETWLHENNMSLNFMYNFKTGG